jgi:hypothetical protein
VTVESITLSIRAWRVNDKRAVEETGEQDPVHLDDLAARRVSLAK